MSGAPLLVTTALEETWGADEPLVFLGAWCQRYGREAAWTNRAHTVVPYHWDDRQKLKRDHDYLDALRERLLVALSGALNRYHGLERPPHYWRMIVDGWLYTYIAMVFDRWECVRLAFETDTPVHTIALSREPAPAPLDVNEFIQGAAFSDLANHDLLLRIIRESYGDTCSVRECAQDASFLISPPDAPATRGGKRSRAKRAAWATAGATDWMASRLFATGRVAFVESYFPIKALIRLNLELGQVPRLHLQDFEWADSLQEARRARPADRDSRPLPLTFDTRSAYERFLVAAIRRDLPYAYLEGFRHLSDLSSRIRIRSKVICSAVAHWHNELFKVWSAEQVHQGARFVVVEHGGSLPPAFDNMFFEEKLCDRKAVWSIPYHPTHERLPPSKLATKRFPSSRQFCSVIAHEAPRYALRASASPIAGQVLQNHLMICDFHDAVPPAVRQAVRVKAYPDVGWNTEQRIVDRLGAAKVYAGLNYYTVLRRSRVVVCTYPNTTFSEAMSTGLPTLLMYDARFWEIIPEMDPLLQTLGDVGILHLSAESAARQLDLIWSDPEAWWGSAAVARGRAEFFEYCLQTDGDWLPRWKRFLDREINLASTCRRSEAADIVH